MAYSITNGSLMSAKTFKSKLLILIVWVYWWLASKVQIHFKPLSIQYMDRKPARIYQLSTTNQTTAGWPKQVNFLLGGLVSKQLTQQFLTQRILMIKIYETIYSFWGKLIKLLKMTMQFVVPYHQSLMYPTNFPIKFQRNIHLSGSFSSSIHL